MTREIYKNVISPVLDRLDSETWHVRAREALHLAELSPVTLWILEEIFANKGERYSDERLKVEMGGIVFDNPLIVGAGWDKPGRAVRALHRLGFAGVEVGTVTSQPQEGNPKPRQWMVGPGVAMNRLGFNGPGMEVVVKNLRKYKGSGIPIGISVGKNKDIPNKDAPDVFGEVVGKLYDDAAYFVINVSSPNTPGLRQLQNKSYLIDIVQSVNIVMDQRGPRKPLFVKISPDLTKAATDDVIDLVLDQGLTGIIATNTTNNSEIKIKYGRSADEPLGVSGNDSDYRNMSTNIITHIRKVAGDSLIIIGVGGINDTDTALEKIRAGATFIQVVTAMRSVGPSLPGRINRGLVDYMQQNGISNLSEIVGSAVVTTCIQTHS